MNNNLWIPSDMKDIRLVRKANYILTLLNAFAIKSNNVSASSAEPYFIKRKHHLWSIT